MATFILAMSRPKRDLMLALGLVGDAGEEIYKVLYVSHLDRMRRYNNLLTAYRKKPAVGETD